MTAVRRRLGATGLDIAPLVLGGNVFGWTIDAKTSFDVLEHFIAQGGTMIDTADAYSQWAPGNHGGESEIIIGDWLKQRGRRDDVQIATKVGAPVAGREGLSAAWIERSIEGSLRRLQTDYVDLYYAHRDDPTVPLDETLAAFDRLIRSGKVRAIAASNYGAPRLEAALDQSEALGVARYGALQLRFNLLERDKYGAALQELCVDRQVGVLTFYSLAMGFLTGAYRSVGAMEDNPRPRLRDYFNERGFRVLGVLDAIAAECAAAPAQVALSWVAAQPGVAAPIASATSIPQLDELLGSIRTTLSTSALERLSIAANDSAQASPTSASIGAGNG